jgi:hypothetical protein
MIYLELRYRDYYERVDLPILWLPLFKHEEGAMKCGA